MYTNRLHPNEKLYNIDYLDSPYINDCYEGPMTIPFVQQRNREKYKLHSDSLNDLCQKTDANISYFKHVLSQVDPCYQYGPEHWHYTQDREKQKSLYMTSVDDIDSGRAIFSEHHHASRNNTVQGQVVNFCYLCTTVEEHQRHLARRGVRRKARPRIKPRIQYIAPPPIVKHKKPEPEPEKEDALYRFTVKTGDKPEAGTSANVFVRLYGNKARMRKRQLKKNFASLKFHFGRNTSETFFVKGPDVGTMEWLTVEHDGQEKRDSWYLEEVQVTNMAGDQEDSAVFVCGTWLSMCMGDYTPKIDLQAQKQREHMEEYRITTVTGKKMLAGTDARVFITLYGSRGVTGKIRLTTKDHDPFERGAVDQFQVMDKAVGPVSKIRIEHDNTGKGPGWYLECVEVHAVDAGRTYKFPCSQWIAHDEGDGQLYKYLYPVKKASSTGGKNKHSRRRGEEDSDPGDLLDYEVKVVTGSPRGAGTDANVYLQMFGSSSLVTKEIKLDDGRDNFERNMTDVFRIQATDVGKLKKIRIRHDNTSLAAGWFLDSITIKRYFSKSEIAELMSKADNEMEEKVLEKATEMTGVLHKKQSLKMEHKGSKKSYRGDTSDSEEDSDNEGRRKKGKQHRKFRVKDSSSDDFSDEDENNSSKIRRKGEEKRSRRKGDSSDSFSDEEEERYRKKSGKKKKKVYSYGGYKEEVTDSDSSDSDERKHRKDYDDDDDGNYKENRRKRSGRSRKRRGSVKKDDEIAIKDGKTPFYEEYFFPCNKWLATDEDDGQISRELKPKKRTVIYKV